MISQADLDFAYWLGSRRRARVARERTPLPPDEIWRRKYDEETEQIRTALRIRRAVEQWKARKVGKGA